MEERQIGPYRIVDELGQGGMGIVYLADDTRLGRQVAIKALPPRLSRDPLLRERLRREARAAAMLSHPGIATVHALEEFDDELFMVSEYVRGHSLRLEIERGPMAFDRLVETSVEIARALAAAHAKGVVHRDLKPENVMRSSDFGIKVLDFGLARVDTQLGSSSGAVTHLTGDGKVVGTLTYMAPEQLLGTEVDFRADIFSFGVMLYELATGIHPFEGADLPSTISRILQTDPVSPSELAPLGHPEIDAIVTKCLRKEPERRYRATADLVRDLEQLRTPAGPQPNVSLRPRRRAVNPQERTRTALWWWQLHQLSAALIYGVIVYPVWKVRGWLAPPWGLILSLAVLVPLVAVSGLRLHLWFASINNRGHLAMERARVAAWVRAGDVAFVLALLAAAAAASAHGHQGYTALIVVFAVGCTLAFLIVEPETTRAAFRRSSPRSGSRRTAPGRSTAPKSPP